MIYLMVIVIMLAGLAIAQGTEAFQSTSNNTNVTNAVKALGADCPFLPSSETGTPLPQMRCHDPECQEYLFSGNNVKNATMEEKCWIQP